MPDIVLQFFKYLIGGPYPRWGNSPSKTRRISSISQDVIYATTSGRHKPAKHLQIGLALKSLTGSRKVIEMMNR